MPLTDRFQALTPRQRSWLPCVALIAAVFATYANVYHNDFVWDDFHLIVNNGALRHWSGLADLLTKTTNASFYRPVQVLLYFVIYQIFGLSHAAFHGVNVLLQAVNTCLVYRLGCRLGFYQRASFAAALLWGVHPLWSISVAYASGTADLLVVFFFMTGLLVLLPDFAPRKFLLASVLFILALGSKESAIVFPALVTLTLFLVSPERLRPAPYIKTGPLWLLSLVYIIGWLMCPALNDMAAYTYQGPSYGEFYAHNFINRILTSFATLPVYFSLIVWPAGLHLIWNSFPVFKTVWDWQVLAGAVMVGAALLQIVRGRGKCGLPLTWGLLWFAAALSPETGILKPADALFAENWIYLPTVGLFLGLAHTIVIRMDSLSSKKVPALAAGLVVLAALGLGTRTYLQNEIFHDRGSFFESITKENPSTGADYRLGLFYFQQKEYEKAAEHWRAVETGKNTIRKDVLALMHMRLAYIYLNIPPDKNSVSPQDVIHALPSSRRIPEAIEELKMAQETDPDTCCASSFLAQIYYYLGKNKEGDYYKAKAEKILPNPP